MGQSTNYINGSEKVDNNKNIRILAIKNKKVAITTLNAKLTIEKLLIVSTKVVLIKDGQDIYMRKI